MKTEQKKDTPLPQRLEALSVFMGELEKMLGEMGGTIMRDNITYESCRSYFKTLTAFNRDAFIFTLNLSFDTNLLCEYAAQSKGQDRGGKHER